MQTWERLGFSTIDYIDSNNFVNPISYVLSRGYGYVLYYFFYLKFFPSAIYMFIICMCQYVYKQ